MRFSPFAVCTGTVVAVEAQKKIQCGKWQQWDSPSKAVWYGSNSTKQISLIWPRRNTEVRRNTPSMAYKERSNSLTSAVPYFFGKKD